MMIGGAKGESLPDADWIIGRCPSTPQGVSVCPADPAVTDLDVDVGFFPWLRFKFLVNHLALGGFWALSQPSLKFIVGTHCDDGEATDVFDECVELNGLEKHRAGCPWHRYIYRVSTRVRDGENDVIATDRYISTRYGKW